MNASRSLLILTLALMCASARAETSETAATRTSLEKLRASDVITRTANDLAGRSPAQRAKEVARLCGGLNLRRLAVAALLKPENVDEAAQLQKLLNDPEIIIRRVAARSLFGTTADERATSIKYAYSDVLEIEDTVREILSALPHQTTAEQFATTRKLAALGPNALIALRNAAGSRDPIIALSALAAESEILIAFAGGMPVLSDFIGDRWRTKITAEFMDAPLEESAAFLTEVSGVWVQVEDLPANVQNLNLRVTELRFDIVVYWLGELADLEIAYLPNGVVLRPRNPATARLLEIVDARDLVEKLGESAIQNVLSKNRAIGACHFENGFIMCDHNMRHATYTNIQAVLKDMREKLQRASSGAAK